MEPTLNNMLNGKTVLVTGGSRGVGRGIAIGLGEYGAKVYITGRNISNLDETVALVEDVGAACLPLRCDHCNDVETKSAIEHILLENDSISILVNSAWGGYEGMVENNVF